MTNGIDPCSFAGCARPTRHLGLCNGHWSQQQKGKPLTPLRKSARPVRPPEERFFEHLSPEGDCWRWTGTINPYGYGKFFDGSHQLVAHRWSYEFFRARIPAGLVIDHLCRKRSCVNPWHMEPVPNAVNVARGNAWSAVNRRKTHCKHGHEFTPENTMQRPEGGRRCRTCHTEQCAARALAKRKAA